MSSNPQPQPSQIPSLAPAPAGWTYVGCYEDNWSRILDGGHRDTQDMTVISCISVCLGNGFSIAGVQGGSQCFCANTIKAGAARKTETECAMACTGDASQRCGDLWRLNIYQSQSRVVAPSSSTVPSAPTNTSPPQAPAPTPSTPTPSSIAIASTRSLASTGAQPSFTTTRLGSDTTVFTATSDTLSTASSSSANFSSTAVILPPAIDQIFTPNDSPQSSPSSGVVAGIAVASTAITAILVVLLFLMVRKWRRRKMQQAALTQASTLSTIPTYYDTRRETLPSYDDLVARNDEGTAISTSPVFVPMRLANSKASPQPSLQLVTSTPRAPTDSDSLSYLSSGAGTVSTYSTISRLV
ncbi:hypothetical protein CVT24_011416 [Panaeolus cyanescens]|uniref:WSC domain-containing protein n=1 Tax=Panaeolus cyanescens TaxID=181874 RepID=A0A409VG95_9AGAR|nr:hypothetical protein CVT24_011416 [Panaeolus cyanescens]